MSAVTTNQPLGTPTWIDLGIPDLDRAMSFYGAVFGWEFDIGPEETGRYTMCLLRGKKVAALMPNPDENATEFWWSVYLATDDVDVTVARSTDAGGVVLAEPMDVMGQGRMAIVFDFALDGNDDLPGMDFTFLRRPDGHEIGGIMGDPAAPASAWGTLFQVADTDAAVAAARAAGGAADDPTDMPYGRTAEVTDPFGAKFTVGSPLPGAQG